MLCPGSAAITKSLSSGPGRRIVIWVVRYRRHSMSHERSTISYSLDGARLYCSVNGLEVLEVVR